MKYLYNNDDLIKLDKQRFKLKTIYVIILVISLIIVVGGIIFRAFLPYNTQLETVLEIIIMTVAILFTIFSFVYLSIPYARVKDYYNFVYSALNNERLIVKATILEIRDNDVTTKYGVDYYYIDVLEWSNSRNDYIKRSIMVDNEFRNLPIKKSSIIDIETMGNMLTAYEILENNLWKDKK